MNKLLVLFNKFYNSKFLHSLIIMGMLIAIGKIALADYIPPPKEETSNETVATTARNTSGLIARGGCSTNQKTFLTALAPKQHIGKTVTTRPTWAWFVPDSKPYQLLFQLYKYDSNNQAISVWEQNLKSQPGMMTLTLPAEQPELSVGQKYLWKVIVLCNPNRPSDSLVVEADLEVIPLPQNVKTKLDVTSEPIARADIFAEAGIWYDAFSQGILVSQSTTNLRFELELLEDLAKIEEAEDTIYSPNNLNDFAKQSHKLRQVIEAER